MIGIDVVPLPRKVFEALLRSPFLHRAQKIWLEQFGQCACGRLIDTTPIWLKNDLAVCEICRSSAT